MTTQVWYHAGCADGFGSAFAFHILKDPLKQAKYVPVQYNEPMPVAAKEDDVYILDFSFPPHDLYNLGLRVASLTVLDHHATSKNYAEAVNEIGSECRIQGDTEFPTIRIEHNLNMSGAALTWFTFKTENGKVPLVIYYVQDRDLWKWRLPWSREINAALAAEKQDLDIWMNFAERLENERTKEAVIDKGKIILARDNKHIWRQVFAAQMGYLQTDCGDFSDVVICNAAVMQSETGDQLLKRFPKAKFAAMYWDKGGQRLWSLRSRDPYPNATDVAAIAELFGGGGHKGAAGFKEDYPSEMVRITF